LKPVLQNIMAKILWADDEIDLLKPHIIFLTNKGYDITPVNSGIDALEKVEQERFDIVFLDEMMPGMTGLETLSKIKQIRPNLPVVMITKSEEESIMEDAIGSKIADYLIKPINPNQVLLSVKKILDNRRLVSEKTTLTYQQQFRQLAMQYQDRIGHEEWVELYKKLIYWELELENSQDRTMEDVFVMQKDEANANFCKFVEENYESWLNDPTADRPILSHHLMKRKVFPLMKANEPLFFILIDNFRFDQWKVAEQLLQEFFTTEEESSYYSILPTVTGFARNAIFAGMMPSEIERQYPQWWVNDENLPDSEEGLNKHEEDLLRKQFERNRMQVKFSYNKIVNQNQGKALVENVSNLWKNNLNVIVYNFVDMLSHARTDMMMIKELAPDEAAYRSITRSWFQHSPIMDLLRKIAEKGGRICITTDHGMIRVKKPIKIVGYRETNTNLRYKQGKNLGFDSENHLFVCKRPERFFLPKLNISSAYVFTKEDYFFAYPNNFNQYVHLYRDTFQHGGLSIEEMIIPFAYLKAK
jgi:CheY-like chemotaxis protein